MPPQAHTSTPPSRSPTILLMDSGLGGLTVAEAILTQLPQAQLVYLADTAFFPYGIRTESDINARVARIALPLAREVNADVVVIACNSASTTALPVLRQQITTPVVGVVPAIKPAAQRTESGHIGLLATPGTVERAYTQNLIHHYAKDTQVIRKGSSELVHWAEQKMRGCALPTAQFEQLLADWRNTPLDTVVLGCTHFPLLQPELSQALPQVKYWVDSGEAIARRVASLLPDDLATACKVTANTSNSINDSIPHASQPMRKARLLATQLTPHLVQTEPSIQRWLSISARWAHWRLPN